MNQAKLETIMAQEKAAGVEYESDRAAQLAAEDILYHEEVAAKAAADTQKSLYNAITLAKIEKQEADALAAKKLMDEEMVASNRAANLAMLADSAKGNFGQGIHGTGAGGGISGIMRETLVIFREIGRGNMTRVPGSLLLLLQYTGMLNLMMKGEKTEALLAAAAQEKLAKSTARAAMAASFESASEFAATVVASARRACAAAVASAASASAV